ncbi:hypothetical protein H7Y40_01830 [Pedobacter sp.]|nr:hypothetical protein [Candidatus Saccharibacteria bacterium]
MSLLRIAEYADTSTSLRELCETEDLGSHTDTDQALRTVMGKRVYYLAAEQMFGFTGIEDHVADRIQLGGTEEMTVRYVGLRAIRASHDMYPDKHCLAVCEDKELTVAVFDTDIARIGQKLISTDEPIPVTDLFPRVGILLDERIELRTRAIVRPGPQYFRPRIVLI